MERLTKKDIGHYVKVSWRDPRSEFRVSYKEFIKNPYVISETKGEVKIVKRDLIILSSESCKSDDEEDLTSIHPALIVDIERRLP